MRTSRSKIGRLSRLLDREPPDMTATSYGAMLVIKSESEPVDAELLYIMAVKALPGLIEDARELRRILDVMPGLEAGEYSSTDAMCAETRARWRRQLEYMRKFPGMVARLEREEVESLMNAIDLAEGEVRQLRKRVAGLLKGEVR